MKFNLTQLSAFVFCLYAFGCGKAEKFEKLDLNVAGPIDVASSQDGKYFYVLNSDFDRTYNAGSLLVISEDGEKLNAIEVPRLGRAMALAGNDLIVLFDSAEDHAPFEIHLYDIGDDPENPALQKRWTSEDEDLQLNCTPVSATLREGYNHFAVSCVGGKLFIGTLKTPRSASQLTLVRDYDRGGRTRRALYIDPHKELLLAFPTDMGNQKSTDFLTNDEKTYDPKTGKSTNVPNEIPDEYEDTKYKRRNSGSARSRFIFVAYDIATERANDFPLRKFDDPDDEVVQNEQKWIYFTLEDFDHTPDTDAQIIDVNQKHYRTNFWSTQPDPFDPNSFYLSHRGKQSKESRFANNIIKVEFIGDPTQTEPKLETNQILDFKRVFGFKGELDEKNHYPGEFRVLQVNGRLSLVVNHFKDLVNFRKDSAFAITAKLLDDSLWFKEVSSDNDSNSYYQLAVNSRGKILTCSFYGNAVIPLELEPGTDIKLGWDKITRIR